MAFVGTMRIQKAFPKMTPEFFSLLAERVIENGFTEQRLKDAVNHVIDNFQYKELNISDIIRFDKKIKLYTYSEVSDLVTSGKACFDDFSLKLVNGVTYRVKRTDLI